MGHLPRRKPTGDLALRCGVVVAVAAAALLLGLFAPSPLIPAPATASAAHAHGQSLSIGLRQRLDGVLEAELRRQGFPGVVAGVWMPRGRWVAARGVSDVRHQTPMRPRDHVRIGSVTKSFVTTELVQLARAGRLSLHDPISDYVKGVPNGRRMTLARLANMTSGLFNYFSDRRWVVRYILGRTFTPRELAMFGISHPPLFGPGEAWDYSNTNTVLLGLVIRKVTDSPLRRVLQRHIFRPLGLQETSLPRTDRMPRPFAHGYSRQTRSGKVGDTTFNTPTATWAAGGMVSNLFDLKRAAPTLGTGRPLLDPAWQRRREQWVTLPPNSRRQRYGIGLLDFHGWIGHNGGIPGYTTICWYLPQRRITLVVEVNSDIHVGRSRPGYAYEPASEVAHRITKVITPHHVAPGAVKVR